MIGVYDIFLGVLIAAVIIWIQSDPEERTKFFLSNPSMAISLWTIAMLLSPSWGIWDILRQVGIYFVGIPWLALGVIGYGARMYGYLLHRMLYNLDLRRRPRVR